ncbi:hypothetical protein NQZ68_000721 [Dissostichus eleginoides]|nr:hypothetical protein NQZ68_000721 [Dissostichus eleginoides]
MFNCCSHGTLLHFGLQSSRLNICYYHQDLHPRRLHPGPRPRLPCSPRRASYSLQSSPRSSCCQQRPADSDFHGHRPAVYIDQHLFWGLMSVGIRRLNPAIGSSRSASSAYQQWTTRRLAFHARLQASEPGFLPI